MAKERNFKTISSEDDESTEKTIMNRRKFMKYGFNSAAGVIAASFGVLGFASILMPGGGGGSGDLSVKYWAKGREDSAWYGSMHLQEMEIEQFAMEASKSASGMAGASGVWNGLPVNVVYVPHNENKNSAPVSNKPRFQFSEGYDGTNKYVGHFEDIAETDDRIMPTDNVVIVFGRCPHLCCIPGWQLVQESFTADNWTSGGTDEGGNKLFCICHSSRFDPTLLEMNMNRNRNNGQEFTYAGIRKTGGPAPVGQPIIPAQVNDSGVIEGIDDYLDWLTFCD